MFQVLYGFPLDGPLGIPSAGKGTPPIAHRSNRVASSQRCKRLVTDEVQAYLPGNASVKEIRLNRCAHISPKLFPGVSLRENVERQTFGAVAPIRILRDFEDEFRHAFIFSPVSRRGHLAV